MPPKTADAAEALSSARREKLISVPPLRVLVLATTQCSESSAMTRLLQRPQAAATERLADQDCQGQIKRLRSRLAGLACENIRLNI
jgi:hypothetical protein